MIVLRQKSLISQYQRAQDIAKKLDISSYAVSLITGTIFVERRNSTVNIGLNLKFNKKNKEVLSMVILLTFAHGLCQSVVA